MTKEELQEIIAIDEGFRIERTTSKGDIDKFQKAILCPKLSQVVSSPTYQVCKIITIRFFDPLKMVESITDLRTHESTKTRKLRQNKNVIRIYGKEKQEDRG